MKGEVVCNALTGDFDAVLQVSGGTLNRLLASMHQNGGTKTDRPTFPHSVTVTLGDRPNSVGTGGSGVGR